MKSFYFKPEEFWAKVQEPGYDGRADPDPELVRRLDIMRGLVNRPIKITSGRRGPKANAEAGGVQDSEHMLGEGADLACAESRERSMLVDAAIKAGFKRIGIGKTFVHVGVSLTLAQNVMWHYYPPGVAPTIGDVPPILPQPPTPDPPPDPTPKSGWYYYPPDGAWYYYPPGGGPPTAPLSQTT